MPIPPFTQCAGGFITTRPLPDGRILVEGWHFNPTPFDGGDPRHETAYHWITTSQEEATAMIDEFSGYLTAPLAP